MGELSVRRDGAFYGVTIRAVLDSGATAPLYVAIRAERVEWQDPSDPSAGPGGWIRSVAPKAVEAELELYFTRDKVHARAVEQLAKWQADPPPKLVGVSSVEQQYVGLIDQASGQGIGIKLTDADQARASSRAYATWSRGKLRLRLAVDELNEAGRPTLRCDRRGRPWRSRARDAAGAACAW